MPTASSTSSPIEQRGSTEHAARQHWMSVLAKSAADVLLSHSDDYMAQAQEQGLSFKIIRAPEVGLTQVRGRMGGTGSQFNLGDMTLTRCVVQALNGGYGYSYIAGRDKAKAQRAAELDALLQDDDLHAHLMVTIIEPLAAILVTQQHQRQAEVQATKVDFFTLVRGED